MSSTHSEFNFTSNLACETFAWMDFEIININICVYDKAKVSRGKFFYVKSLDPLINIELSFLYIFLSILLFPYNS